MLRILGRKSSSNVQKVLWCCDELDIPFEREDYGAAFGNTKDDAYQRLNPNSLIPTVVEDDFVLWESNSIIRYLAASHADRTPCLYPADLRTRARGERWMDWQLSTVSPAQAPVFLGLVRAPEAERNWAAINQGIEKFRAAMTILDGGLAEGDYLSGAEFSVADISLGMYAYRWFELPLERPELPRLSAWYERLMDRPAFRRHVMIGLS
ncbi:MAG: glutathione S-transferase [Alphaproteobacteria bacterium]